MRLNEHTRTFVSCRLGQRAARLSSVQTVPKLSAGELLNDLGRLEQHVVGDGEAEGLGRLEIDHEVEAHRLLNGQVGRLRALEDLVHVSGGASKHVAEVPSIADEAAC